MHIVDTDFRVFGEVFSQMGYKDVQAFLVEIIVFVPKRRQYLPMGAQPVPIEGKKY